MFDDRESKIFKAYLISISLTIALAMSSLFLGMAVKARTLIYDSMLTSARTNFNLVVAMRHWSANYGGVYVEKRKGVLSNPYLKNPDVKTVDGRTLTLRNPAIMTREVSEFISAKQGITFHITSKMALNPANTPDKFENEGLEKMELGGGEFYRIEQVGGASNFRYIAPLYVEEACLECHADQGYKLGDVRGAISVNSDVSSLEKELKNNQTQIVISGLFVTIFVIVIMYLFTRKLMMKLIEARREVEELAIRDPLTCIYNRRYMMQRLNEVLARAKRGSDEFCCFIMDIDHFKQVNDKYGHLFGDEILIETVKRVSSVLRSYDIFGRFGGEEFIIITPGLGIEDSLAMAERVRQTVKDGSVNGIKVTISIGVSCYKSKEDTPDDIIRRADESMYVAKKEGRDCVRCLDN